MISDGNPGCHGVKVNLLENTICDFDSLAQNKVEFWIEHHWIDSMMAV